MADTSSAGAMPVVPGATPGQSSSGSGAPQQLASAAQPPATGAPDELGESGKRALDSERDARKAAVQRQKELEVELEQLRASNQSESDKALTKARKEGAADERARVQGQLRRSGVKSALVAAGVNAELLDLATKDDVFADLKVSDEGEVEGLDAAIAALRKARPSLFTKAGDFGGGNRGATPPTNPTMDELLRAAARG